MKRGLGWAIVGYLLAAAVFELVLALRLRIGPHGEGFVLLFALAAMVAAVVLVFRSSPAAPLFAPGAALFVTARFYTGDPYYRPTFRTYADGGIFSPAWVFTLLGLAFVAGLTTYFWRRTGSVESAVVLALLFLTALYMGAGH